MGGVSPTRGSTLEHAHSWPSMKPRVQVAYTRIFSPRAYYANTRGFDIEGCFPRLK
jgi:hypothetical protein